MKFLSVFFVMLLVGFQSAFAEEVCPAPEGCYTDKLTYEVINDQGKVIDRSVYERLVPISYTAAMELKYLRLLNKLDGAAQTWLQVKQANGEVSEALNAAMGK